MSERPRESGFTILELIIVMGLISVMMGVGIGFLQRGSTDLDLAISMVRDQFRVAANTARSRGLPTEVRVTEGDVGEPIRLQARVLANVGSWHFEPEERWFDQRMRPQLSGNREPRGRFGEAWRPDPEARSSMMSVAAGGVSAFQLDQGFALRLEVKLEERTAMGVVRLGRAFEFNLTEDLVPEAKVTLADPGPRPGPVINVRGSRALRTDVWITLELVHDGVELVLFVDGREESRVDASGSPFQRNDDVFEVSLGSAPVLGVVDEVQLLAYERGPLAELPLEVEVSGLPAGLRFNRRGELLEPVEFTIGLGEDRSSWSIGPGGVLIRAKESKP